MSDDQSGKKEKLAVSIGAPFLLSLTLFFFGPAHLYFTNNLEMPFLFSDIWYMLVAFALVVALPLTLLMALLKDPYHKKAAALIFAVGLLLWVQGNLLVRDYGLLDGHEIVWSDYAWQGAVDALVWIGVIAASFLNAERLYRHIALLCAALIVIQAAGLAATAFSAEDEPAWKYGERSDDGGMYGFSTGPNVVIIILDTFQSDLFQEIVDEDEEYAKMFDGFTYYRNSAGGFPTTYPSIDYILTGEFYDNSVPVQEFIRETTLRRSLPLLLKENGATTEINPKVMKAIYANDTVYDTIESGGTAETKDLSSLYHLTFFRYLPQEMKKIFYNDLLREGEEGQNSDLQTYQKFRSAVHVSGNGTDFKVFHLQGPHRPYTLNEDLTIEDLPQNRSGCLSQARASLKIAHALLESLQKEGVYDNSVIFIIGDHGTHKNPVGINRSGIPASTSPGFVPDEVVAGGIPLMLVKPFDARGSLNVSDAPVSLGDIAKTVADELEIENDLPGSSIFSLRENESRVRMHYYYDWSPEYFDWHKEYLPSLEEYRITGFSWESASWQPTYRTYTPDGVGYAPPPDYEIGSVMRWGSGGNAERYLTRGWSHPENGFTWTDGHAAALECSLNETDSDLVLTMNFSPFLVKGQIDSQDMRVWANGYAVGNYTLSTEGFQKKSMEIPRSVLNGKTLNIVLELPDAASPSDAGLSTDSRHLGIAMQTLRIDRA
jgi:hypothetical protein